MKFPLFWNIMASERAGSYKHWLILHTKSHLIPTLLPLFLSSGSEVKQNVTVANGRFLCFLFARHVFAYSLCQSISLPSSLPLSKYLYNRLCTNTSDVKTNGFTLIWWEIETRNSMIIVQLTIAMVGYGSVLRERGMCSSMPYYEEKRSFSDTLISTKYSQFFKMFTK